MEVITQKNLKNKFLNSKPCRKIEEKCLKDAVLFLFEKMQNIPISTKPVNLEIISSNKDNPESPPLFGDHPDKTV